jgi:hypothetical protein
MLSNPTLTADEFKVLHNTLWDLDRLDNPKVSELVERIRTQALKGAYEQEDRVFDRKHTHFSEVRDEEKFASIWSVFEVENLDDAHPYASDCFVTYQGQHCAVYGSTWRDVWRAADHCIRLSGDLHHIYVEGFEVNNKDLAMYTGS